MIAPLVVLLLFTVDPSFFLLPPDFFLVGVMIGLLGDMIIEVVTGEVMVVVTMGAQIVDVEIRVCGWVTIKF